MQNISIAAQGADMRERRSVLVNLEPVSFETECTVAQLATQAAKSGKGQRMHNLPDPVQFYIHQQQCQLALVEEALDAEFGQGSHPVDADTALDFARIAGDTLITLEYPEYGEQLAVVVAATASLPIHETARHIDATFNRLVGCLQRAGLDSDLTVVPARQAHLGGGPADAEWFAGGSRTANSTLDAPSLGKGRK